MTDMNKKFKYDILIVESDKESLKNMRNTLDELHNIKNVFSVDEAIDELNENYRPHLIVSNTHFAYGEDFAYIPEHTQGSDLLDLIKEIKDEQIKNIPVIFITSSENTQNISELFKKGALDIIKKPVDDLELTSRIDLRIQQAKERIKLRNSLQDLMTDMKNRNKKNLDFRTQIFAKHKESMSKYESEIAKLREEASEKSRELDMLKTNVQNLRNENNEMYNELRFLRIKQTSAKQIKDSTTTTSLEDLKDNEVNAIERIFGYLNKEFLFEEEVIKNVSDKILQNEVDFRRVDNFSFINNVVKIIKRFTREELMQLSQDSEASRFRERLNRHMDGLLEYIAKHHISKYLFYFSMKLLEVVGTKDDNATRFLRFYDGRVEIGPNGVRYQKPMIGGKDNSWNMVTIMQIINQRANGYVIVKEQEDNIKQYNDQINVIFEKLSDIIVRHRHLFEGKINNSDSSEEKIEKVEKILQENKNDNLIKDIETVEVLGMDFNRIKDVKKGFVAKYAKQVAYYKPTEEKFAKVALSLSKIMLKVKVV
jgi:CheY-like chemotaxis protein